MYRGQPKHWNRGGPYHSDGGNYRGASYYHVCGGRGRGGSNQQAVGPEERAARAETEKFKAQMKTLEAE